MNMRKTVVSVGVVLFAVGLPAAAVAQGYTFTSIVDTDDEFDGFNPPSINNAGVVAFFAFRDDGSAGVFTSDGVTTTTIVDDTGDFSFFGGGITLASFPAMGNNGEVAFFAYRDYGEQGIYKSSGGSIITIAESGTGNYECTESNPSINDYGFVAFRACLTGIGGALLVGDGTTTTNIIDESGEASYVTDMLALNNGGTVAFVGTLSDGREGIFATAGGAVTTIADTTGDFAWFQGPPDINDAGLVAFCAFLGEAYTDGIFTGDGTTITTIADTLGPFDSFDPYSVGVNNAGQVAFVAQLDTWERGIFTGDDPNQDAVIQTGDALFGSTVSGVELMRFALNDNGQIAFVYHLEDGRTGIAVATPDAGCPGDLDGDGDVDLADLAKLLAHYGVTGGASYADGDLDGDGDVDLADLAELLAVYGTTC